jgi:hypothetical protein
MTFSTETQIDQEFWNLYSSGPLTIRFHANDTSGNVGWTDVFINKVITFGQDTQAPSIAVLKPLQNATYGADAPTFEITILEPYLNVTWYSLFNGTWSKNVIFSNETKINQESWNLFPNGPLTIRFYANDTSGNIGWVDVLLNKNVSSSEILIPDTQAPNITVLKPFQNATHGTDAPTFEIIVLEPYLNATWYSLFNGTWSRNVIFSNETKINQESWNLYFNGPLTIRFYANDTSGNIGWADVLLNKVVLSSKIAHTPPPQSISGIVPLFISLIALVSITILIKKSTKNFRLRIRDRS